MSTSLSARTLAVACALIAAVRCIEDTPNTGLRSLLFNERNQKLIDHLGTRYEVVYPFQIRKDWTRGLSTRSSQPGETFLHLQETTFLIETREYKLQLDLELNTKLFAPTLVQLLYSSEESPIIVRQVPENCYYHGKVRNYPDAKAAFQTCDGIRGTIRLGNKIFFIHPLYGNHSGRHPHLLYHYQPKPEDYFICGSEAADSVEESEERLDEKENWHRQKYIEIAIVFDQSLFRKFQFSPSEAFSAAGEIINYVDLLYRPLNTSVSLVYLELWLEDQTPMLDANMMATLHEFKKYMGRRISRFSVDAAYLLTSLEFGNESNGHAFMDSICTSSAVGLSLIHNVYQPHLNSFVLAHMVGHSLGMGHDHHGCECPNAGDCVMENNMSIPGLQAFSRCSLLDYQRTLSRGYGACLYNMPTMRASICGNGVLEEPEQCDCGTAEECLRYNPCCDPLTCRLIKHAQCSSGPCCRMCKLMSPDQLCRPSRGECDIPEFCDGIDGQCPEDVFKRDGEMCSDGLGYCFRGECPVLQQQCRRVWGEEAESADAACFERLNVQGTPNGNCGPDGRGGIAKCDKQHSYCGFLQCSSGEKTPLLDADDAEVHFVVHRINAQGAMHECKTRTFPVSELKKGLVRDGTKCGFQKLCLNQTCTSLRNLVSGKCPMESLHNTCSGHGICTNSNTCVCEDGWKGQDCGTVDEDWRVSEDYYESSGTENPHHYGQNEMRLNPNLAITVIAASIVIGLALVFIVALIFFYRHK